MATKARSCLISITLLAGIIKLIKSFSFYYRFSLPIIKREFMREKKRALASVSNRPKIHSREFVLGVDGGGTKTRAVVMDEEGRILGEGLAGPSNPLRVGVQQAVASIGEAIDK